VAGIPDLPVDEVKVNLAHDSVIIMDPEVIQGLSALQSKLATAKPADLQAIMKDYTDLILKLYQTLGLDLNLTVTLPKDIADLLTAQAGGIQVPEEIKLKLKLVDGFLYVNLDDLAASIPELQEFKGWYGADLANFMSKAMDQANQRQASEMQGLQSGLGAGTLLTSKEFRTMLNDYVNVERQPDGKLDLQKVAVFRTTFDFGRFVASQAFQDMLKSQLDLINQMSERKVSPQEFDEVMMGLKFLGPSLFQDLKFEVIQNIGAKDNFIYRSETHFHWDLKSLMGFAAMAQGGGKAASLPKTAPVVGLDIVTDYADFNNASTIEKPEDANIIPLDQMNMNSVQ